MVLAFMLSHITNISGDCAFGVSITCGLVEVVKYVTVVLIVILVLVSVVLVVLMLFLFVKIILVFVKIVCVTICKNCL